MADRVAKSLEGKVALVTGAARGIGLATAKAFAEAGASVIAADRDKDILGEVIDHLRSCGHNATAVTCDVTDKAQVTAMIERAVDTYGRLDAPFNNAGINCDSAPCCRRTTTRSSASSTSTFAACGTA
jgi:NAD(P)-dependent dehydrogenase (short-subunit alcohol dehydrogenase family)